MDNIKFVITNKRNEHNDIQLTIGMNKFATSCIEVLTNTTIKNEHYLKGDYIWLVSVPSDATIVDNKTNMVELVYRAYLGLAETYDNFSLPLPSLGVCTIHHFKDLVAMIEEKMAKVTDLNEQLITHVKLGNVCYAKSLIKIGADVNYAGSFNNTALHWASSHGNHQMVAMLLEKGANPNLKNENQVTALDLAKIGYLNISSDQQQTHACSIIISMLEGRTEKSEKETEIDIEELNKRLLEESKNGNIDEVQKLILDGANVNCQNDSGMTSLHLAILYNRVSAIVKILLENNANVDSKDDDGDTPLHCAVTRDNAEITKMLLDKGANVNCKNNHNWTALHMVAKNSHYAVAKILLENGADLNAENNDKNKPIDIAKKYRSGILPIFEEYMEKINPKPAILMKDNDDLNQQLLKASENGDFFKVDKLINKGANVNAYKNQYTALHWASKRGNVEMVNLLLEKGADVNAKSKALWTPLHSASFNNNEKVVKILLDNGADMNTKNDVGNTPLDLAKKWERDDIVSIMEKYMKKNILTGDVIKPDFVKDVIKVIGVDDIVSAEFILYGDDDKTALFEFAKKNCYQELCQTVLMKAAEIGDIQMVETSLKEDIDEDKKDIALKRAGKNKHYDICKKLIKAGANPKCLKKELLVKILLDE